MDTVGLDKLDALEEHGADDCAELAAAYVELQSRMIAFGDDMAARFEARRAAIAAVVAHKASPPEYPGLALVPVSDIERLEQFARTSWRETSRALHSSGDDEPYATDRKDGAS